MVAIILYPLPGSVSWGQEPRNVIGAGMALTVNPSNELTIYSHLTYERQIHSHWYVRISFFMMGCSECESSQYIYSFPIELVHSFHLKGQAYIDVGVGLLPQVVDRIFELAPFPSIDVGLRFQQPRWMIRAGLSLAGTGLYLVLGLRF